MRAVGCVDRGAIPARSAATFPAAPRSIARRGTNHFLHAGWPADRAGVCAYDKVPYAGLGEPRQKTFAEIVPPDADASAAVDSIVQPVDTPFGKRPFRVHIDPTEEGRASTSRCSIASAPRCSTVWAVGSAEARGAFLGRSS